MFCNGPLMLWISPASDAWWPGLLLVAFGLLAHLAGYAVQQPRISVVGLFIGIYGLTGLAWGPGWLRTSFFPFILFGFSVPLGSLGETVTSPMRILVARIVTLIAHLGIAHEQQHLAAARVELEHSAPGSQVHPHQLETVVRSELQKSAENEPCKHLSSFFSHR